MTVLDAVASAGLAAWAVSALATGKDAEPPLSLMDTKSDVVRFGHLVVRKVAEWRSGLSRFDRSQRLWRTRRLGCSLYFDALAAMDDSPMPLERLGLNSAEKAALTTGGDLPSGYADMIELLLREPMPLPQPHLLYVEVREQILGLYGRLSGRLLAFVSGLALWDELDERRRERLEEAFSKVPARALGQYDDAYRNLAIDNREFEVWAGLTEVHALGAGLSRLAALLAEMATRQIGHRPHTIC